VSDGNFVFFVSGVQVMQLMRWYFFSFLGGWGFSVCGVS